MNQLHIERMRKLAEHLRTGQLGHKKFGFWTFNNATEARCGTIGCAVGECPILFPDEWTWLVGGNPGLRKNQIDGWDPETSIDDAAEFFGISDDEAGGLFVPNCERPWAGSELSHEAT